MMRSLPLPPSRLATALCAALLAFAALATPMGAVAQPAEPAAERAVEGAEDAAEDAQRSEAVDGEALSGPVADAIEPWLTENAPALMTSVVGNPSWRYLALVLTVIAAFLLRRLLMGVVMVALRRLTQRTKTDLDDAFISALDPPLGWLVTAMGTYLALIWIRLGPDAQGVADKLFRLSLVLILGWALVRSVTILDQVLRRLAGKTQTELDDHLIPLVSRVLHIVVIGFVAVLVMQELGFNVAGVVAGLGVGGLAFALAAQDTVANWFGALMIYTDRPFETGDWIKTSSLEGVVEDIGLRSTRVRTFAKTVVSVPNRDLANDTIENFSRMPKRRISFKLGVTYATTPAMMEETLERIRDILRNHPDVDQSFWLVRFTEFGDSALNIMIYFFTTTTDWDRYLTIRQGINLDIMRELSAVGVQAAFPSRSLYLENIDPAEIARLDADARERMSKRPPRTDVHVAINAPTDDDG